MVTRLRFVGAHVAVPLLVALLSALLILIPNHSAATAVAADNRLAAEGYYNYDGGGFIVGTAEGRLAATKHPVSKSDLADTERTPGMGAHLRLAVDSSAPRTTPGNDFQVVDPVNPGRTITDIDTFRPGQLVELKSATSAADPQAWIQKHIVRKTESYLEARQHIPGWEQADIVFEFTKPGVDQAFVRSVNEAVTGLDATTPGVNVSVRWAP